MTTAPNTASESLRIVIVSRQPYDPRIDDVLLAVIARRAELISVAGVDCGLIEDIIDELIVGPKGLGPDNDGVIPSATTSSHPGDSVLDVFEFAWEWISDERRRIEVIEL